MDVKKDNKNMRGFKHIVQQRLVQMQNEYKKIIISILSNIIDPYFAPII